MIRAIAVVALVGCSLTQPVTPRELRYFTLVTTMEATRPAPCARVRLGRVSASPAFGVAIQHRLSAVEVQPYETLRWSDPPEVYVRRSLARALFGSHPLDQGLTGSPVLDIELVAFEHAAGAPAGTVTIAYQLRDDEHVVARGQVSTTRPAASHEIEAIVAAIGTALDATSEQLAEKVVAARCS
jgi:ABC-type uncharacterized transport system auxiliary subunit